MQSWDPFDAPGRILARFGGRFENGWPDEALLRPAETQHVPLADVFEDAEGWHVLVELPGVGAPELAITLLEDCLIVEAERLPPSGNSVTLREVESRYGALRREFMLPPRSEPSRALADLSSGILHVLVPRRPTATRITQSIEPTSDTTGASRTLLVSSLPDGGSFSRQRDGS